ncbi:MAG: LrgB family protein [Firmicutes bacterium]|nr:LrgB family protein [Bacillota bacterium]
MNSFIFFLADNAYFGAFLTIGLYYMYKQLADRIKFVLFNPILLTVATIIAVLVVLGIPYDRYYASGAEVINWLLTPATVCFAIPLYRQVQVLKANAVAILASIFMGSLASVGGILIMAKAFGLPLEIYASLAPKSVTTPIATGIAGEMGGIVGCTVIAVICTGILGSIFTTALRKLLQIKSDIAWGLATGTSSHAIGTSAAMAESEVAGAMGSLSIAVAGVMTVVIVPLLSVFY